MGASNALRVYAAWGRCSYSTKAGKAAKKQLLADQPLRVLVYMALVARDDDSDPWYGQLHETLGAGALGLDIPEPDDTPETQAQRDVALRTVRRAITALHKAGAIETTRRATFGTRGARPARYRLYLDGPPGVAPVIPIGSAAAAVDVDEHQADDRGAQTGAALARRLLEERKTNHV